MIDKVIELRDVVNDFFRGNISREQAVAKLGLYENESWFKERYLYSSSELPADITKRKWHYQMDYDPLPIWKQVSQPTSFLFAETDEWVSIQASIDHYRAARAHLRDITLKQIKGTSHLMSVSSDLDILQISPEYLAVLLEWLASRFR